MVWWIAALAWAGLTVLNRIFQPRLPKPKNAAPEAFQGLTAELGRAVPVVWGTRYVKNANIPWFGDLSHTAIVDGGSVVGYKYYMGAQYIICMGEIDDLVEVRFNDIPAGATVTALNNRLVLGKNPPTYVNADVAEANYPDGQALSVAVEDAIHIAEVGNWKVGFGAQIVAGRNNRLIYGVKVGADVSFRVREFTLPSHGDSPGLLAAFIAAAMNDLEDLDGSGASFSVTSGVGGFQFLASGVTAFSIFGAAAGGTFSYTDTMNATLGLRMDVSTVGSVLGPNFIITSAYAVQAARIIIAYGGTTAKLKLTDPGFTAAALLGFTTGADITLTNGGTCAPNAVQLLAATYTDAGDYFRVDVDAPAFFGTEGGVVGRVDVYKGSLSQAESSYLTGQRGSTAPAFRAFCYAVQQGMYVGNTNYPKPLGFVVKRCPNQLGLGAGQHDIAGDANPACALWELLTDEVWGARIPASDLDQMSFLVAGATLATEGLGISLIVDASGPAEDIADEILRHIDAVLYQDPSTGLLCLRLARNDYVVGDLVSINVDNEDEFTFSRRSPDDSINLVRLRYVDRVDYTEKTIDVMDLASIQARGGEVAMEEFSFPGISSETNARLVGARVLKAVSHAPAEIDLKANREAWALRPGLPFRLTLEPLGITDMPCRVTKLSAGTLEDGSISLSAVEDLVGPAWSGFEAPTDPALDADETPVV